MSRPSVIAAIIVSALSVVLGLSLSLGVQRDPTVITAVAASTPENPENPKCKPCVRPDGTESGKPNTPPNVTELALDKTEFRVPCPDAETAPAGADSSVEVNVTAEDADGDVLVYNFVISGGRIVGQGKKVFWDVSKLRAGTYSITAAVDDGCGLCGKTATKMLTVADCRTTE